MTRNKGEEFEVDDSDEGELIYNLLRDLRITIIDSKFVPVQGEYICIHDFSYENQGLPRYGSVGKEITLGQEKATEFLVRGLLKPSSSDGWTPVKLLGATVKETEVRKMYDPEEVKENWVKNYNVRSRRK